MSVFYPRPPSWIWEGNKEGEWKALWVKRNRGGGKGKGMEFRGTVCDIGFRGIDTPEYELCELSIVITARCTSE